MIGGDPHVFLETFICQEIDFRFRGKHYFCQGYCYHKTGLSHMEVMMRFPPYECVWEHDDPSAMKCLEEFLKAPIFDGKTFWEVEEEIEWFDE